MNETERQLGLRLGAVTNRSLFPEHFLRQRLADLEEFRRLDPQPLLDELRGLFEREREGLERANEAQTEDQFIRPVLDRLGFHYTVQTELPVLERRRQPDYALFLSDDRKREADRLGGIERYGHAVAVAEAKKFDRPLEQRRATGALTEDPVAQITDYVLRTKVPWGILTNGRMWRLYAREGDLVEGACYEVDLVALLEPGDAEGFRLFAAFFSSPAFEPDAQGRCFLDRVLDEGRANAEAIGDTLERQVFGAVPPIAEGLLGDDERDEPNLDRGFENALVVLYRLLFCLHAEARALLPIDHPHYLPQSLRRQKQELAESIDTGRVFVRHSDQLYSRLRALFTMVDQGVPEITVNQYDGGLFAPQEHPYLQGRVVADDLLAPALDGIYRVDSRFVDYRELAVRHLGTIYERLLAYRLEGEEDGLGLIEDERRRETGSYFTPAEIVDLIVSRTLEPVLTARSDSIAAGGLSGEDALEEFLTVRVLDPAMGSAHFLVSATAYIARFIANDPSYTEGELPLSELRRLVVERCIYGVDVNPLAVELAKLSLWLTTVARDEPLTFLGNLRIGNSLVGAELDDLLAGEESVFSARLARDAEAILEGVDGIAARPSREAGDVHEKERLAGAVEELREPLEQYADETISPEVQAEARYLFHWELEFPEVFLGPDGQPRPAGGFDAIVGNPPYIRIQALGRHLADYCRKRYVTAHGSFDAYTVFLERCIELLAPSGRLGFIVPNKFMKLEAGAKLRELLAQERLVEEVLDFGDSQLFEGTTNYTCVLVLDRTGRGQLVYRKMPRAKAELMEAIVGPETMPSEGFALSNLGPDPWVLAAGNEARLLERLGKETARLDEVTTQIFQGLITSADRIFIVQDRGTRGPNRIVYSRASEAEVELEPDLLHHLASGGDVEPYAFRPLADLLLFPYGRHDDQMGVLTREELDRFPHTAAYLRSHEAVLRGRERGKMDHDCWYGYVYPKNLQAHQLPKLGVPRLCDRLRASADTEGEIYLDNVDVNGVLLQEDGPSIWVLAVLLNSRLLDFVFRRISVPFRGQFLSANKQFIAPLPINIPAGADGRELDKLGRTLYEAAAAIGRERKGFLDWLGDFVGPRWRQLEGKTKLAAYEELATGDLLDILRRNRKRLGRSPDSREFREQLEEALSNSRERLGELQGRLSRGRRSADPLVYELYELNRAERALVESEYE